MDVSRTPASRNPACYYRVQALHAATTAGSCSMEYMYLPDCFVIITVADRTLSASPEPRLCLALVKKRIEYDLIAFIQPVIPALSALPPLFH